jgi:hypothetical protein
MNAYNMDCRMKMMQAVNNPVIPRSVAKFAHRSYHSDVPLLLIEGNKVQGVLPSETGPRQGCPAGGLIWNISNQPAYDQALEDLEDVKGLAITDDFVVFGNPANAFRAHARYEQSCKDDGHVTVPDKGFVLWPYYDRPCPQYIRRLAKYWGLELRVGATKLWGTYVGDITTERDAISFMQKRIKKYDPFFKRLMHPNISRHHANILLRTCLKLAPTYWARTIPPDLAKPAMQEFDKAVWKVVTEKLLQTDPDTDLGREATTKILTPIPLGGLGIRPMEMICDPAFMAAWLEAMPSMKNDCLAEHDFRRDNALYPELLRAFDSNKRALPPTDDDDSLLPGTFDEFAGAYAKEPIRKLQAAIVKKIEGHRVRMHSMSVTSNNDRLQKARTLSSTGKYARTWLTTMPTCHDLFLEDGAYTKALRLRLGMPPTENMPDLCACGYDLSNDDNHFLNCLLLRGSVASRQHDRLVRLRARHLQLAGCTVSLELSMRSAKPGKRYRPDTIVWAGQHSHMSDTTRVNATAPSHRAAAQTGAAVATRAEERKSKDYDSKVLKNTFDCPGDFYPIAYEIHGTWSRSSRSTQRPRTCR